MAERVSLNISMQEVLLIVSWHVYGRPRGHIYIYIYHFLLLVLFSGLSCVGSDTCAWECIVDNDVTSTHDDSTGISIDVRVL